MAFKLSDHVAKLDYDFGEGVTGTIPEPSSDAVNHFVHRMGKALESVGVEIEDASNQEQVAKAMRGVSESVLNSITTETVDAVCELTQDHPTKDQLVGAGHRPQQAFVGWLMGELNNPEG